MILHSKINIMFRNLSSVRLTTNRTFKNFGHKREQIPLVTTLWHGFLTFTFIGTALNWDAINKFFFGDKDFDEDIQKSLAYKIVED